MVSTLIWTRATFNWSEANALTCTAPPYLTEVPRSLRGGTHDKAPNMLNTRLYNVLYRMIISKYWMRFLWYPEKLRSRQVLSAKPKAEADNTYRDLDYLGYHKNRMHKSNHCFYTLFWRKKKHRRKEPGLILLLKIKHCSRNLRISQLSAICTLPWFPKLAVGS